MKKTTKKQWKIVMVLAIVVIMEILGLMFVNASIGYRENGEMFLQGSNNELLKIMDGINITSGNLHISSGNLHLDGDLIHDQGTVSFSNGNFSIDDNTFFINPINNRIGIGTTNPARTLHIQDDNGVIRIDRDTNSPGFILARFPNNNYTIPWKSFIIGVAADGSDNGTFHITDFGNSVSGGGDRRLTIENDGTVDILGNIVVDKIYLQDSGTSYMGWGFGDGVFKLTTGLDVGGTLFASDISGGAWTGWAIDATDYILTPIIRNTDGDTLTIQDNLDVNGDITIDDGELYVSKASGNPSINFVYEGNPTGQIRANNNWLIFTDNISDVNFMRVPTTEGTDLKLLPHATANVELFGTSDVGNDDDGKEIIGWRKAPEGDEYWRIYITDNRKTMFHSSTDMTFQGQSTFIINSVDDNIFLKLGDSAGIKEVRVRDKAGSDVSTIDSNGNSWFRGDMEIGVNSDVLIQANGDTYFNGGNFGIGTTSPTQKLDVVGSIKTSEAIVFNGGSTLTSSQDGFLGHISTAVFKQELNIDAVDSSPRDMQFKPDGTKVYISGVAGQGIVYEYDLSIPWNISSMIYNSNYFNVNSWENNPMGLFIRNDGKKMYVTGSGGDEVNEFDLTTAWDITSAEWVNLFDCSSNETQPAGIEFRPDGKKMYVIGTSSDAVNEYDLSVAWDITTAVWNQEFGEGIDAATGFSFSQDGIRMYVMDGSVEDDIHEYILSTPWDISTAKLERLFDVSSENAVPQDIAFSPDLTKVYMIGSNSPASLFEYDLGIKINGKLITINDVNLSNLLYVNKSAGYIGMGTTNPTYMLDVRQPNDKQAFFVDTRHQAAETGGGIMFGGYYTDAGDMAMTGEIRTSKANSISGDVGFDLVFETQDSVGSITERARFTSDGYVGIGTNNPTSTLDIHGELSFAQTLGDKISLYGDRIGETNMYGFGVEGSSSLYSKSYSSYRWYINSNADEGVSAKMQLDSTGLGIGTSIPHDELHINSTSPRITFEESDEGNSEKVWMIGVSNEVFSIKTAADNYGATQTVFRTASRGGTGLQYVEFPNDELRIGDTNTGSNEGTPLCIDSNDAICKCGSCA